MRALKEGKYQLSVAIMTPGIATFSLVMVPNNIPRIHDKNPLARVYA